MSDNTKPAKVPTPSDSVRKAAVEIEKEVATGFKMWNRAKVESLIESHCHVTEMEAVIEKVREDIDNYLYNLENVKDCDGCANNNAWAKSLREALSAIDALKGDK